MSSQLQCSLDGLDSKWFKVEQLMTSAWFLSSHMYADEPEESERLYSDVT